MGHTSWPDLRDLRSTTTGRSRSRGDYCCSSRHNLRSPNNVLCSSNSHHLRSPNDLLCSSNSHHLRGPNDLLCSSNSHHLCRSYHLRLLPLTPHQQHIRHMVAA